MLNSVNTNVGAMIALQNLNSTTSELAVVQGRVNTGKKITSAKDNGAIWAIAQGQRAESQSINAVKESLQRGVSTVDVAMSAGERVSDLLLQMKEKALAASDAGLSAESRKALEADYVSLAQQVTTVVDNASFNDVNMLKGTTIADTGTSVKALANATATSTIDVDGVNFQFNPLAAYDPAMDTGLNLETAAGVFTSNVADADGADNIAGNADDVSVAAANTANAADATALVTDIDTAIQYVSDKLSSLGTGSNALSSHLTFMSKLQDSLDAGVGALVDADLAKESARLQALQTKQQLGIQALSIANSSSSVLLGLFR